MAFTYDFETAKDDFVGKLKKEAIDNEQMLYDIKGKIDNLKKEILDLEQKITSAKSNLDSAKSDFSSASTDEEREDAENEVSKLETEIYMLELQLKNKNKQLNGLQILQNLLNALFEFFKGHLKNAETAFNNASTATEECGGILFAACDMLNGILGIGGDFATKVIGNAATSTGGYLFGGFISELVEEGKNIVPDWLISDKTIENLGTEVIRTGNDWISGLVTFAGKGVGEIIGLAAGTVNLGGKINFSQGNTSASQDKNSEGDKQKVTIDNTKNETKSDSESNTKGHGLDEWLASKFKGKTNQEETGGNKTNASSMEETKSNEPGKTEIKTDESKKDGETSTELGKGESTTSGDVSKTEVGESGNQTTTTGASETTNKRYGDTPAEVANKILTDKEAYSEIGNGKQRSDKLKEEGYTQAEINETQKIINIMIENNKKDSSYKFTLDNAKKVAEESGNEGNGGEK